VWQFLLESGFDFRVAVDSFLLGGHDDRSSLADSVLDIAEARSH
jgi:hypothetical protein